MGPNVVGVRCNSGVVLFRLKKCETDTRRIFNWYPHRSRLYVTTFVGSALVYSQIFNNVWKEFGPLFATISDCFEKFFRKENCDNLLILGGGIENGQPVLHLFDMNFKKNIGNIFTIGEDASHVGNLLKNHFDPQWDLDRLTKEVLKKLMQSNVGCEFLEIVQVDFNSVKVFNTVEIQEMKNECQA
uniref:Uncharacterized protein n=1 Tax=Panagrolaimus sp. JU765 TaxID=591449 RepID=A0AC34RLB7_9BILA